jgi:regulator of sigma E protease
VINVLPFPALDGGRLLFIAIEAIMRKPMPTVLANGLNLGGFALLMLLMLAVTYHDVAKLFQ